MSESLDFNPALPESRQFTPPAEGGNGNIHKRRLSQSDLANPQPGTGKLGTAAYRHPGNVVRAGRGKSR